MKRWQIFLVKLQPKQVSLPAFIAYWVALGLAVLTAGLIWGF